MFQNIINYSVVYLARHDFDFKAVFVFLRFKLPVEKDIKSKTGGEF